MHQRLSRGDVASKESSVIKPKFTGQFLG